LLRGLARSAQARNIHQRRAVVVGPVVPFSIRVVAVVSEIGIREQICSENIIPGNGAVIDVASAGADRNIGWTDIRAAENVTEDCWVVPGSLRLSKTRKHVEFGSRIPGNLPVHLVAIRAAIALASVAEKVIAQAQSASTRLIWIGPGPEAKQRLHAWVNTRRWNDISAKWHSAGPVLSTRQRIVDFGR